MDSLSCDLPRGKLVRDNIIAIKAREGESFAYRRLGAADYRRQSAIKVWEECWEFVRAVREGDRVKIADEAGDVREILSACLVAHRMRRHDFRRIVLDRDLPPLERIALDFVFAEVAGNKREMAKHCINIYRSLMSQLAIVGISPTEVRRSQVSKSKNKGKFKRRIYLIGEASVI